MPPSKNAPRPPRADCSIEEPLVDGAYVVETKTARPKRRGRDGARVETFGTCTMGREPILSAEDAR